jgi:hypothetical protein
MKKIVFLLYLSLSTVVYSNFSKGMKSYKNSDYESAFLAWFPLAQAQDGIAQYNIGKLYQLGKGTRKDEKKALKWFKKALKNGITPAKQEIELLQPTFFTSLEAERLVRLETKKLKVERLKLETDRLVKVKAEKLETERLAKLEAERLEAERLEAERLEAERLEAERLEAERLEAERLEAERLEAEKLAKLEADRSIKLEVKKLVKLEVKKLRAERLAMKKLEADRLAQLGTKRLNNWKAQNNAKLEKNRQSILEAKTIAKRLSELNWNNK